MPSAALSSAFISGLLASVPHQLDGTRRLDGEAPILKWPMEFHAPAELIYVNDHSDPQLVVLQGAWYYNGFLGKSRGSWQVLGTADENGNPYPVTQIHAEGALYTYTMGAGGESDVQCTVEKEASEEAPCSFKYSGVQFLGTHLVDSFTCFRGEDQVTILYQDCFTGKPSGMLITDEPGEAIIFVFADNLVKEDVPEATFTPLPSVPCSAPDEESFLQTRFLSELASAA